MGRDDRRQRGQHLPPRVLAGNTAAEQARFQQAVGLHQRGMLAEAEAAYPTILRLRPDHFDALHLLGVVALQTRRPEQAAALIGQALGSTRAMPMRTTISPLRSPNCNAMTKHCSATTAPSRYGQTM